MMRRVNSEKAVPLPTRLLFGFALSLLISSAVAQNNLGELLDAGASKLSVDEFKQEVVQRTIRGLTASGELDIEVMYVGNGTIQGIGSTIVTPNIAPVAGEWTTDRNGRVCATIRIGRGAGYSPDSILLPTRCQYWFKYKDDYFIADSDFDRSAKVLRRTVKQ